MGGWLYTAMIHLSAGSRSNRARRRATSFFDGDQRINQCTKPPPIKSTNVALALRISANNGCKTF